MDMLFVSRLMLSLCVHNEIPSLRIPMECVSKCVFLLKDSGLLGLTWGQSPHGAKPEPDLSPSLTKTPTFIQN